MPRIYSHSEQVRLIEELQQTNITLKHRARSAEELVDGLISDVTELRNQLRTMTDQRDEFIKLARNLDSDFNQGKIFKIKP